MAKAKVVVKPVEEKTPFRPVPYETGDVRTSITLLSSIEIDVVIRALSTLAKYSDEKDINVTFLYKNGIVPKLLDLLVYANATILRFTLKLLSQTVTCISDAALELSFEQYTNNIKQIVHLFMSSTDNVVKEFCVQFLAHVVKSSVLASSILKMGVVATVFDVLTSSQDVDTQYYTLNFFNRVLDAREATTVIPQLAEFSPRTLLCYTKHQTPEVRMEALNIIAKVASWRSPRMQALLRDEKAIEKMFALVLDDEYRALHKKCLGTITVCMQCPETATYFVQSLEFVKFAHWAKTCAKKFMLPAITILAALSQEPQLKQILFDFSVEDSILSFLRTENEEVFSKVCEGIRSMSAHMYCCEKMVTPVVVKSLLHMLTRTNASVVAIDTLLALLKRNDKTIAYIAGCSGFERLKAAILKDCSYNILYVVFIFASDPQYRLEIMDNAIYQMLLVKLEENSEQSHLAVLVLDQYINEPEYREFFLEHNGPSRLIDVLNSTPSEEFFKNTLLFMERIFAYKNICMVFLWEGGVTALEELDHKLELPVIRRLLTMMYNLYLPLKFFKFGRLEITDHFDSRFYLVEPSCPEFPFLEVMERMQVCSRKIIYVVDFSADVSVLTKKSLQESRSNLSIRRSSIKARSKHSTLGKSTSTMRASKESQSEICDGQILCRVTPPVKFGCLSDDPYLPQYLTKLQKLVYENENYVFCFQHQIKAIARFVNSVLSGPPYPGNEASKNHCMAVHLEALRQKLGTTLIPLGYLRYGFHCEKSLLFKALSDRLGVPSALVRGPGNLTYWNEVPVMCSEQDDNVDETKTYMTYAVVDLMSSVGNLMLVGGVEANEYCGLPPPYVRETVQIFTLKNVIKAD